MIALLATDDAAFVSEAAKRGVFGRKLFDIARAVVDSHQLLSPTPTGL